MRTRSRFRKRTCGRIEIRRYHSDEDQVPIEGLPQSGTFVQFVGPEAAAIDIQIPEDSVTQHKYEQREKAGDQMEPPASIQEQCEAGNRLDQWQTHGEKREKRPRHQIIDRDGRGKRLRRSKSLVTPPLMKRVAKAIRIIR